VLLPFEPTTHTDGTAQPVFSPGPLSLTCSGATGSANDATQLAAASGFAQDWGYGGTCA